MNASTIISINPSQKTAGSLHPEVTARFLRCRVISGHRQARGNRIRSRVDGFFGISRVRDSHSSVRKMWVRIAFGLFAAACVATSQFGEMAPVLSIAAYILCGMLCVGLCLRAVASVAAAAFLIPVCAGAYAGEFVALPALCALVSLTVAMTGPGVYSIDAHLRHHLYRNISRRSHRRASRLRMSYKAYSTI